MSDTKAPQPTSNVASILNGLQDRKELAADLRRSERTVIRFEKLGLPVIVLGALRLYDPPAVRAWLLTHERRHDAPRRGRPRKAA